MERLTKRKMDYCQLMDCGITCTQKEPCDDAAIYNKLRAYEDAEEQGLLVRLPCKVGSHVWRVWITDGRKPEITEHYMSDLLHIVQWIDKFGKTVFLTREEAVASIPKED